MRHPSCFGSDGISVGLRCNPHVTLECPLEGPEICEAGPVRDSRYPLVTGTDQSSCALNAEYSEPLCEGRAHLCAKESGEVFPLETSHRRGLVERYRLGQMGVDVVQYMRKTRIIEQCFVIETRPEVGDCRRRQDVAFRVPAS